MNLPTADDANAAANAGLPQDVLASVLLRLPASDVRPFRRVSKDWREVISHPVFINEHLDHGPWALTHTIVFVRGHGGGPDQGAAEPPHNGQGFLFDEQWRLVATFTAGESEEMVGTCNGLLCFLDVRQGTISVVEPFTGESLAVPLPPETDRFDERGAYCFGFDASSRKYKIIHQGGHTDDYTTEQHMYVYTIGGGESWRRVQFPDVAEPSLKYNDPGEAEPSLKYNDPVFADGKFYSYAEAEDRLAKVACFDLATEEITSKEPTMDLVRVDDQETMFHVMADTDARVCVMTVGAFGEWDMFFKGEDGQNSHRSGVKLPDWRGLALPQALQRGHLLLEDRREGGIYVHPVPSARDTDLGSGKLLLKIGKEEEKEQANSSSARGLFVPAMPNQVPEIQERVEHQWKTWGAATFCYATPLSPAPLARRYGLPQSLAENKVTS